MKIQNICLVPIRKGGGRGWRYGDPRYSQDPRHQPSEASNKRDKERRERTAYQIYSNLYLGLKGSEGERQRCAETIQKLYETGVVTAHVMKHFRPGMTADEFIDAVNNRRSKRPKDGRRQEPIEYSYDPSGGSHKRGKIDDVNDQNVYAGYCEKCNTPFVNPFNSPVCPHCGNSCEE